MDTQSGQFNILDDPLWRENESGGVDVIDAVPTTSGSNNSSEEPAVADTNIFNKFIEASAELVNDTHILITLNAEQNQENDDANYELLNKIYDNFETETNFFKKIKLRFLSDDFDLDSVSGFTYNREVQLELKKYKTENDEWIEDEYIVKTFHLFLIEI